MERAGHICRLPDMATDREEQTMLWKAAVKAIGRALKQEFQTQRQEMPDNLQKLLSQLETKGNPKNEK
jgi:hypothetical protein